MSRKTFANSNNCLLLHKRGAVLSLTMNRPDQHNSLNGSLIEQLRLALRSALSDDCIRVVILTGSGMAFCTGADLNSLGCMDEDKSNRAEFLSSAAALNNELRAFSKPLIAALNGLTCAGGLELAMCCDLIVAAESVRIGDAHINFAAFPGGGGACVLPRRVGLARAKYLLFTGELIPAKVMKDWGLVNEVVEDEELAGAVAKLADRIAEKSPAVLSSMKRIANRSESDDLATGLAAEQDALRRQVNSADFCEGMAAFLEKRKPVFK